VANASTYTIGKVVKRLQVSHPSLTVSKVRFLESEGLVKPQRTKSGYRMYTDKDIERLDAVLRLQETCYYPLQFIKEKLDAADAGMPIAELGQNASHEENDEKLIHSDHAIEEIPALISVPVSFVRQLSEAGIITIERNKQGKQIVSGRDLPIIRSAYELKKYGIDPRILRQYLQQTNRELPMYRQILSSAIGRQGSLEDEKTRKTFDETLSRLLELTGNVREGLTKRELLREFNYPKD
jgi:DNA-binding transcriptional MerR regulator